MKMLVMKMVWLYTSLLSWPEEKIEAHNPVDPLAHSTLIVRYYESKILPVIVTVRQDFNKELSEDEKKIVSKAQNYLQELMEKEHIGIRDKRLITKALVDQLRGILNKHKKSLDAIQERLAPEYKQWQGDIYEIANSSEPDSKNTYITSMSSIHFILLDSMDLLRPYLIGI